VAVENCDILIYPSSGSDVDSLIRGRREECTQTWIGGQRYDWRCREKRAVNERYCGVKGLAEIR